MTMALMEHQNEGVRFLLDRGAGLLAFEQGLGKTLVAIEAFRRAYEAGKARRLVVICPNSLKRNWVSEFGRFAPGVGVVVAEGTSAVRRATLAHATAPVIVASYETARAEVTALLAVMRQSPTALVLDESHAAKNLRSLTSTAARHLAPLAAFRWLLSGTPVTNTPADLYSQIEILEPGKKPLGSFDAFVASMDSGRGVEIYRPHLDRLIFRRTKDQCLDLPEKSFVDLRVDLQPWQRRLYDDMRDRMACAVQTMTGEEYRAFAVTALSQLTRLTQIASNPALVLPNVEEVPSKHAELLQLVDEILAEPVRKLIVWSSFVGTIETLVARLAHHGAAAIYGSVAAEERQHVAQRFQTDPTLRVLVANPAAAGTGFTLTAGTFAIYESLSWRYDFYAQSQDRIHRIGQRLPVTYVRLIAADTVDEAIVVALERKTALARSLLGDDGHPPALADLTREQMYALLTKNVLPDA